MFKLLRFFVTGFFLFAGNAYADLNSELWWAVKGDNLQSAEDLVARGADVNYHHNLTLLMISGSIGSIAMTDFLLAEGADPLVKSDNGNTTVMWAAGASENGSLLCEKFVQLGVNPLARNNHGNHALATAGFWNNLDAIEYLLGLGVPVDYPGYRGQSAFFKTTYNRSFEAADYLLSQGADINFQDELGYSALFRPAMNGKLSVGRYLIEKGIDVNLRRRNGDTALTVAIENNQTAMADLIRSAGGVK